jgi:cysteine desulfurase/selenocysteine lyase
MGAALASYRDLFPVTRSLHYLNHAAVSPTSTRVRDAVQAWLCDLADHGMEHIGEWVARERETRALAAKLVGAAPDEIAFVRSTSHGLGAIAEGIDWRAGDEVAVCTELEYPANVYPWMHLGDHGVVLRPIPAENGAVTLASVSAALSSRTRLVSVSAVQFSTGVATDLSAIGTL